MNLAKEDDACRICGEPIKLHFGEPLNNKLSILGICFGCNFWIDKVEDKNSPGVVIIDGHHYHLGKDDPKDDPKWKGFAGQKFTVEFFAPTRWLQPKIVTTNDLWYQGVIPERFRQFLPDNAKFIGEGP